MTIYTVRYSDFLREAYLPTGMLIQNIHLSDECKGDVCPIHKPSDHSQKNLKIDFNPKLFMFVRILNTPVSYEGKAPISIIPDPDDYTLNTSDYVIMRNAVTCLNCDTYLESTHRHHCAICPCDSSGADGGSSYLRRLGNDYKEESILFNKSGYLANRQTFA